MIRRTFGAPLGGTTRGGHQDFDSEAFSFITPPNFGSGGGSCLPSMVVVAPGEPETPVVSIGPELSFAATGSETIAPAPKATAAFFNIFFIFIFLPPLNLFNPHRKLLAGYVRRENCRPFYRLHYVFARQVVLNKMPESIYVFSDMAIKFFDNRRTNNFHLSGQYSAPTNRCFGQPPRHIENTSHCLQISGSVNSFCSPHCRCFAEFNHCL